MTQTKYAGNHKFIFKDKMLVNPSTDLALRNAIRGVEYTDNGYFIAQSEIFKINYETKFNKQALQGIKGVKSIMNTDTDIVLSLSIESQDPIIPNTFVLKIRGNLFGLNLQIENIVINVDLASAEFLSAECAKCFYSLEVISSTKYVCNVTFRYLKADFENNFDAFNDGTYIEGMELTANAKVLKKATSTVQIGNAFSKDEVLILGKNPLFHNLNGYRVNDEEENKNYINKFYNKISYDYKWFTRDVWVKSSEPLDKDIIVEFMHGKYENIIGDGKPGSINKKIEEMVILKNTTKSKVLKNSGLSCRNIMGIYECTTVTEGDKTVYKKGKRIDFTEKYVFDRQKLYRIVFLIESQAKILANKLIEGYAKGRQSVKIDAVIENISDIYGVGDCVYVMNCREKDYLKAAELLNKATGSTDKAEKEEIFINENSFIRNIHGQAKKFVVTSAEISYNGGFNQNLDLLEVN